MKKQNLFLVISTLGVAFFLLIEFLISIAFAAEKYPNPRYPAYLKPPKSVEDLMPAAREAVRQTAGKTPLGLAKSGQHIGVISTYGGDLMVKQALVRAYAERGVTADFLWHSEALGYTDEEFKALGRWVTGGEGYREILNFRGDGAETGTPLMALFPKNLQEELFIRPPSGSSQNVGPALPALLNKHPEWDGFFAGEGGPYAKVMESVKPGSSKKFWGYVGYVTYVDLVSKVPYFPSDLQTLVEQRILQPIPFVSKGTFTDPEGTDISWSVTPEQAKKWYNGGDHPENHIFIYPNGWECIDMKGVIAGCSNHSGFHPRMEVYIDKGMIQRIEGGGKAGEVNRFALYHPKLSQYSAYKYPNAPSPGHWYVYHDGFGISPKYVRDYDQFIAGRRHSPNTAERNRAGTQHFGFGYDSRDKADVKYAMENKLPNTHLWHIHNYFTTVKWQLRDTGEWITVSDKGFLPIFDDKEVRALAAKYGDPDKIFQYDWIPEIPGINVKGDYQKDYGSDPWKYIMKGWEEIKAGTYRYFVKDYKMLK